MAKVLLRLGDVSYSGNVSGKGRMMTLSGLLRTDVGRADVRFRHDGGRVEAYVNSAGLDVGRLLDNGRLGMLATTVKAWCRVGKGGISDVRIDGVFRGSIITVILIQALRRRELTEGLRSTVC